MDEPIRAQTPEEHEAECIAADLEANRDKAGKAHRAQERNAMRLERQWADRNYR
jgi:hypothetical protein